jgi:hypothetical protein
MPNDRHDHLANGDDEIDGCSRLLPDRPRSHTHVQQVCDGATSSLVKGSRRPVQVPVGSWRGSR